MGRCVGGNFDCLLFFLLPQLTDCPVPDKKDDNAA